MDNLKQKPRNKIKLYKEHEIEWLKDFKSSRENTIGDNLHNFSTSREAKIIRLEKKQNKKLEKIDVLLSRNKITKNDANKKYELIKTKTKFKIQKISKTNNKKIEIELKKSRKKRDWISKFITKENKAVTKISESTHPIIYKLLSIGRPTFYIPLMKSIINFINKNKLLLIIAIIAIAAGLTVPVFFTSRNIMTNILKNNAEIGIMAVGMSFVILTGGIDLSVGSLLGLLGIFIAKGYVVDGYSMGLSIFLGVLITLMIGLFQGLLISKLKLPPFIVTLVGLLGYRGLARIVADSKTFTIENDGMKTLNTGEFIGIPYLVWILLAVTLIGMFILKFTKIGRNVYAVGGNEEAAKMSGIKTWVVITFVYVVSAITVMIATISFASRVGSFSPLTGSAYELDVISAVVLGGTSLTGGKGGVGKTIMGWLVISTLSNAMLLVGYSSDWQLVFKGIIILAAVILDKDLNIVNKIKKIILRIR